MNKDKRNNIQLLGTLNNADESGIIANANQIYDDVQQKGQETINSELIEAVGTGGSVDTRITNAVNVEKTRAEGAESTLDDKITAEQTRAADAENALDGRVDTLEEAVGTGGSVDSRIASAVATETSRAQDVSKEHTERIKNLETKESSMQTTLENITKTGETSAASNVTYNHNDSKLDATNVQQAIDEVSKKSNYNDGDNIIDFNTIHLITDNPEFVCVAVDVNEKILYGIKTDGQPYFGVGCPQQVKDYIDEQRNKILDTNDITTTIDSLKEIEDFLKDFTNSDTLKKLLDLKANVDEVRATTDDIYKKSNYNDGDNIIDFNTIHIITDNPEFVIAAVDANNKILYGIKADGQPYWGVGVPKVVDAAIDKAKPFLYGKKFCALGDSITDGDGNGSYSWYDMLLERYGATADSLNFAETGQCLRTMADLCTAENMANIDICFVAGGTNQLSNYRLGTIDDDPTPDRWEPNKAYSVGDKVLGGTMEKHGWTTNIMAYLYWYECVTAGTSGNTADASGFNHTVDSITTDGTVEWKCIGNPSWYSDMKGICRRVWGFNPKIQIVWIVPIKTKYDADNNVSETFIQAEKFQAIRDFCKGYSIRMIDLQREFPLNTWTKDAIMADNLHPNRNGYKIIQDIVCSHIE